jgi:hypothetical protein
VDESSIETSLVVDPIARQDRGVDGAIEAATIRTPLRSSLSSSVAPHGRSAGGGSTFDTGWSFTGFSTNGIDTGNALLTHDGRDTSVDDGTDEFVPALFATECWDEAATPSTQEREIPLERATPLHPSSQAANRQDAEE